MTLEGPGLSSLLLGAQGGSEKPTWPGSRRSTVCPRGRCRRGEGTLGAFPLCEAASDLSPRAGRRSPNMRPASTPG